MNERSVPSQDKLKKMIRLLKTLIAEAEEDIEFSGFDIYALCYAMPINLYTNLVYIHLMPVLSTFYMHK